MSTGIIYPSLNDKSIIICWLLAEIAGHFWKPAESDNLANPEFENLKHFQNLGYFLLTLASMYEPYLVANQPHIPSSVYLHRKPSRLPYSVLTKRLPPDASPHSSIRMSEQRRIRINQRLNV